MPFPLIAAGIMAGGSIIGGMLQSNSAKKAAQKAEQMAREAAGQFNDLYVPTAEEMQIQIQKLIQAGEITPEDAQAVLVAKSAYDDVNTNNAGNDAQLAALQELSGVVGAKGLTATDRAKIADIQEQMGTTNRGAQEAILQNAAERGISGSGLELAAKLSAEQNAASDANRAGLQTSADAEKRALEAMIAQGNLGGQVNEQDFAKQAKIAEAKDLISKFNATNQQEVGLTNTAARNTAQATNLAEKQRIADANIAAENANRARNSQLKQTQYENELEKRKAKAAALTGGSQSAMQRAQLDQQFAGNLIGTGGQLLGNVSQYWGQDKKKVEGQ
jgi:hypothetical protein